MRQTLDFAEKLSGQPAICRQIVESVFEGFEGQFGVLHKDMQLSDLESYGGDLCRVLFAVEQCLEGGE